MRTFRTTVSCWSQTWVLGLVGLLTVGPTLGCERRDDEKAAKQRPERAAPSKAEPEKVDDDPSTVYLRWRDRFEKDPQLARSDAFERMRAQLREVTNDAKAETPLRANAALLLGAVHEARGETKAAIGLYRHAAKLMPDDAGPHMALALALAADEQFEDAAKVQARATELDPDNLENWLTLAELLFKAGDQEKAKAAYVDYERRRKGLIDGLTLKRGDDYMVSAKERAQCARALSVAVDQGTANALIYALKSEPDPDVRATVAEVMGVQRLAAYRPALEAALVSEKATPIREAIAWALGEISRDPVELEAEAPAMPAAPEGDEAKAPGGPDDSESSATK